MSKCSCSWHVVFAIYDMENGWKNPFRCHLSVQIFLTSKPQQKNNLTTRSSDCAFQVSDLISMNRNSFRSCLLRHILFQLGQAILCRSYSSSQPQAWYKSGRPEAVSRWCTEACQLSTWYIFATFISQHSDLEDLSTLPHRTSADPNHPNPASQFAQKHHLFEALCATNSWGLGRFNWISRSKLHRGCQVFCLVPPVLKQSSRLWLNLMQNKGGLWEWKTL